MSHPTRSHFARHRDHYAGALIALIGAGAITEGWGYGIGSLGAMGSGYFPVALGGGMVALGVLMAVVGAATPDDHASAVPDWRGAAAIAAGVALFIALAKPAGLAPATFACVFAAALGARRTTIGEAALLALGVTVFGVALFSFGLKVQFPVVRGFTP